VYLVDLACPSLEASTVQPSWASIGCPGILLSLSPSPVALLGPGLGLGRGLGLWPVFTFASVFY
jgi:hypothetical protein